MIELKENQIVQTRDGKSYILKYIHLLPIKMEMLAEIKLHKKLTFSEKCGKILYRK